MSNTPILNIAQVASNQNQKETTINTGFAILEASINDANVVDLAAADYALSIDDYTKWFMQRCQNHTVARNLDTPAPVGTFTGKRFFIVSNEGTATVTVRPGGEVTGTIDVLAGKIVLIQSDGTTLRAVSSGVALLTDLSDVDVTTVPPTDGQVLRYSTADGKWIAGDFSSATFTGLTDTPADYTGQGLKALRVKSTEDGIEFVAGVITAPFTISGMPGAGAVYNHIFVEPVKLVTGLTGSQFFIGTDPTADMAFGLNQVVAGAVSSIGSVTFGTDGVATIVFTSDVSFAAGDVLQIAAPAPQDATGADIAMNFKAVPI